MTGPYEIRQRINERLQIMGSYDTSYSNGQNTEPGKSRLAWVMWALVLVAVVAALRGW